SKAFHTSGTFHSMSIAGRVLSGTWIFRLVPVGSRNFRCGITPPAAISQSRAEHSASIARRSQRGAVAQEYRSRQFWRPGWGLVSLFHIWYGLIGLPAGSVGKREPAQAS